MWIIRSLMCELYNKMPTNYQKIYSSFQNRIVSIPDYFFLFTCWSQCLHRQTQSGQYRKEWLTITKWLSNNEANYPLVPLKPVMNDFSSQESPSLWLTYSTSQYQLPIPMSWMCHRPSIDQNETKQGTLKNITSAYSISDMVKLIISNPFP